jgi:hypothetical protein
MEREAAIRTLAERVETLPLQRGGQLTRALVVVNETPEERTGRARFAATFPIRASVGAQPVTLWDTTGDIVPSRVTVSILREDASLPTGRVWWEMALEFAVTVPARGWTTIGATFGEAEDSRADDAAFWETLPLLDCAVVETECHPGDLPLTGTFGTDASAIAARPQYPATEDRATNR